MKATSFLVVNVYDRLSLNEIIFLLRNLQQQQNTLKMLDWRI